MKLFFLLFFSFQKANIFDNSFLIRTENESDSSFVATTSDFFEYDFKDEKKSDSSLAKKEIKSIQSSVYVQKKDHFEMEVFITKPSFLAIEEKPCAGNQVSLILNSVETAYPTIEKNSSCGLSLNKRYGYVPNSEKRFPLDLGINKISIIFYDNKLPRWQFSQEIRIVEY